MIKLFEIIDLYRIDLNEYKAQTLEVNNDYSFGVFESNNVDLKMLKRHFDLRGERYNNLMVDRFKTQNYFCFYYLHKNDQEIAYTRWICCNKFYSDRYKKNFSFSDNEAITLDSYTHPNFRKQGLHKRMNIEMLQYLKEKSSINRLYMIIIKGNAFLNQIVEDLGYVKVGSKIRIYVIKTIKQILNKLK